MKYQTNYLLSISRIPDHFYALIHGLEGRDVIYSNPGVSLRTFVLAGTNILNECLYVPVEMMDAVKECEDFTFDQDVYKKINHALHTQPYDVIEKILHISKDAKAVQEVMKRLNEMNHKIDETYDILLRNTLQGSVPDMLSSTAADYKQSLIDMKFYASELVSHLDSITPGRA